MFYASVFQSSDCKQSSDLHSAVSFEMIFLSTKCSKEISALLPGPERSPVPQFPGVQEVVRVGAWHVLRSAKAANTRHQPAPARGLNDINQMETDLTPHPTCWSSSSALMMSLTSCGVSCSRRLSSSPLYLSSFSVSWSSLTLV